MGLLRSVLSAVAALLLLFVAVNLENPLLADRRVLVSWIDAGLGVAGALAYGRSPGLSDRRIRVLWTAVPLAVVATLAIARHHVSSVLSARGPDTQELGRHFIVGYTHREEVETLAVRGLIGGVFITHRNAVGRSTDDLRQEVAGLQRRRSDAGLPPLLVATDQEGGPVSRLSPPLELMPALASLALLPEGQRTAAARAYGERQGLALASLGVTMDFAPVVDLRLPRAENPLDLHTHLNERAISADPRIVSAIALAYGEGLASAGITPTLKHFPGLGRVAADTHLFSAALETPRSVLEGADWVPFRQVLQQSSAALMVGHVAVTTIDADHPASRSRAVIQGLLRDTWGFDGVVVTDDMTMGAIYLHGYCQGIVDALNAGADLLLVSWDGALYYPAMDCALRALHDGRLDREMLRRSDARLQRTASARR